MNSNYGKSLAQFLFKKMEQRQTDPVIKRTRARLDGTGFYFSESDLKEWIEEHDRPKN